MIDDLKGIFFLFYFHRVLYVHRRLTGQRSKSAVCAAQILLCCSTTLLSAMSRVWDLIFYALEIILLGSSTYRYCFFVPRDIYSWRTTDDSAICISGVWSGATTRACAPIRGVNKSHGTCVSITV
jgi:hypothetical protein